MPAHQGGGHPNRSEGNAANAQRQAGADGGICARQTSAAACCHRQQIQFKHYPPRHAHTIRPKLAERRSDQFLYESAHRARQAASPAQDVRIQYILLPEDPQRRPELGLPLDTKD